MVILCMHVIGTPSCLSSSTHRWEERAREIERERLTGWPLPLRDARKHAIQLCLVLGPLATHHGHAHGPDAPAEQWHPSQLDLGKPATSTQHAGLDGEGLDHVEVSPAYVVGDDDGGLPGREVVAGHGDLAAIEVEDQLDPFPDGRGDEGRGIVDGVGEEVADWEEQGQDHVHEHQTEGPWDDDEEASQSGEGVGPGRHFGNMIGKSNEGEMDLVKGIMGGGLRVWGVCCMCLCGCVCIIYVCVRLCVCVCVCVCICVNGCIYLYGMDICMYARAKSASK